MISLIKLLSSDQVQSLARHALTAVGGILVSDGVISSNQTEQFVSAGCFFISIAWSMWDKAQSQKQLAVAKTETAVAEAKVEGEVR